MTNTIEKNSAFSFPKAPFMTSEAQNAITALSGIQGEAVKAALRYQIEALSFLQKRFEKNVKLLDALAASKEHGDAYDVCVDFYREAFSDYSDEAGKLAKIESKIASDTAKKIQKESLTFVEDVATQTAA